MVLKATIAYRKFSNSFAAPWLMKCDDSQDYVVKFEGERNDKSVVNELIAGKLAKKLDLPVADPQVIKIDSDLLSNTKDLQQRNVKPGNHIGTLLMNEAYELHSNIAKTIEINKIENLDEIPGIIAFDTFVHNTDRHPGNALLVPGDGARGKFRYLMIDHGHCFGGPNWTTMSISSLPISVNQIPWKKDGITTKSFETINERINKLTRGDYQDIVSMIPSDWNINAGEKEALVDVLDNRDKKSMIELLNNYKWNS